MKILLICAGGCSTGLLMKKMEKYWAQQNEPLEIKATGLNNFEEKVIGYDIVLVGPQIRYRFKDIQSCGIPCEVIDSLDYGMQNVVNIKKQAERLYSQIKH